MSSSRIGLHGTRAVSTLVAAIVLLEAHARISRRRSTPRVDAELSP